ncbi:evolutionarily conserved signaling intermediate in Toll pathway, mitochondrial [Anastrepha obliqua]|uniref:evolutionarily conserved signaling intermediate in Toll pathway, mitochondrial n=1 Tax=Anastrepha obliqua TaxID=95512 RepID=UPI002409012B|nr:evolutionarily conserved signaling intermediate in Toll pathway, mitochondrial [Anastrepha obliqua]XP_054735911.1 evolutionarily conserved signaling intermediate in Toll pathway, mitochondrial [Anastrepha obliqua]XP_054735919.1 evolutionarily conserved signaling intermediate in Toll pathway, mitochondrial [Anastrepha obliqua]
MLRQLSNLLRGQLKSNGNSFKIFTATSCMECSRGFYCTKATNGGDGQSNSNTSGDGEKQKIRKPPLPAVQNPFANVTNKTRESYLVMLELFTERDVHRRNHVEFIYAALRNMADFGVEHDIEVYKALINVMPKGKFIPNNVFQAEFMHYPKQQQCIIDLLEQMEDLGVIPDYEMEAMLLNIFGRRGHPLRKYWRMMYWMPKFKNLSPWPLPNPVPDDTLEIAKIAIERMCTVDVRSKVSLYETKTVKDAIDDTWIVSGMSVEQSQLLRVHERHKAIYIEGPFLIWLRNRSINYFTLRADPDPDFLQSLQEDHEDTDDVSKLGAPFFGTAMPRPQNQVGKNRSVHQQEDGTIFAICATGTSTKDSLLSWIRLLEINGNPALGEIPVLFRFTSAVAARAIEIESPMKSGKDNESPSKTVSD